MMPRVLALSLLHRYHIISSIPNFSSHLTLCNSLNYASYLFCCTSETPIAMRSLI